MKSELKLRNTTELAKLEPTDEPRRKRVKSPPTGVFALNFWLYLVGFGLFGALGTYAAFATIQSAVVAGGSFEVEGNLRVVDHLEGGIVRQIHVQDGQMVNAGDPIISLDTTRARAQMGILKSQLAGSLARKARLDAEFRGAETMLMTPELITLVSEEPSFAEIIEAQAGLLTSNRSTDVGEITIYGERIRQMEERMAGVQERARALRSQLKLIQEEARMQEDLLARGLTRRVDVIRRQEGELNILARLGDTDAEEQDVLKQMAEMRAMQSQVQRQRQAAIASELREVSEDIVDLRQRIDANQDVLARLEIRAPITGQIIGFEINTVGEVIAPGQRILRVVPNDSTYLVEARVSTADIDEIAIGSPARIRLSSYSYRKTAPVSGEVTYISGDALMDADRGQSFYQIHVRVSEEEMAALPDVRTLPGMPAQVMVATQEQSIITHLLDPVLAGLETAFVEGE